MMARVREQYKVPAKRGGRIRFRGKPGVITGTPRGAGMYLYIRMDTGQRFMVHPTWEMEYL